MIFKTHEHDNSKLKIKWNYLQKIIKTKWNYVQKIIKGPASLSVARDRNVCAKCWINFENCSLNLLTFSVILNIIPIHLIIATVSITAFSKMALNAECWYAQCRSRCGCFFIILVSVVLLSADLLNVVAPKKYYSQGQ